MTVDTHRWNLLEKAADRIAPTNFDKYFELRRLLANQQPAVRHEFQTLFANYYRLHNGGLTEAFKQKYFDLLFAFQPSDQADPYTSLLLTLYHLPRRKGDHTLQASFVSKLVAIHDESRPLYDVYVSKFFGVAPPGLGSIEFRVAGFVANLLRIQREYESWARDSRFNRIVKPLITKHPKLGTCHSSRLCDFLVWAVGAYELK